VTLNLKRLAPCQVTFLRSFSQLHFFFSSPSSITTTEPTASQNCSSSDSALVVSFSSSVHLFARFANILWTRCDVLISCRPPSVADCVVTSVAEQQRSCLLVYTSSRSKYLWFPTGFSSAIDLCSCLYAASTVHAFASGKHHVQHSSTPVPKNPRAKSRLVSRRP
jgi:hypothetical protein